MIVASVLLIAPQNAAAVRQEGPKVAVLVAPAGDQTATYVKLADEAAEVATESGARVSTAYAPEATRDDVMYAVRGANIVVYFGERSDAAAVTNLDPSLDVDAAADALLNLRAAEAAPEATDDPQAYFNQDWIARNARPASGYVMIYSRARPAASDAAESENVEPAVALRNLVPPLQGNYILSQRFHGGHAALDLAAAAGTPVYAVADGVVSGAGRDEETPYAFDRSVTGGGIMVAIRHPGGLTTQYAHLLRLAPGLTAGDRVRAGDIIGTVGSTGRSTGNHLHFGVFEGGRTINPLKLFEGLSEASIEAASDPDSEATLAASSVEQANLRAGFYSEAALRSGAAAYYTTDFAGGATRLVRDILRSPSTSYGDIFRNDPAFPFGRLDATEHPFLTDRQLWMHRSLYNGSLSYWYAFAGDPEATLAGTGVDSRRIQFRTARALTFAAGRHVGHQFDEDGTVTRSRSARLREPSSATTTVRTRIPGRDGYWFKITDGVWKGYYIRESKRVFLPGNGIETALRPERSVLFSAGEHVGYRFTRDGIVADAKPYELTRRSMAPASRRAIINGERYLFISAGIWDGYWVRESDTVRVRPLPAPKLSPTSEAAMRELLEELRADMAAGLDNDLVGHLTDREITRDAADGDLGAAATKPGTTGTAPAPGAPPPGGSPSGPGAPPPGEEPPPSGGEEPTPTPTPTPTPSGVPTLPPLPVPTLPPPGITIP